MKKTSKVKRIRGERREKEKRVELGFDLDWEFNFLDPPEKDLKGYPTTPWTQGINENPSRPEFKREKLKVEGKAIRGMWAVTGTTKMGIPFIMLTPRRGDTARVWNNALISNQCDPSTAVRCAIVPDPEEK